MSRSVARLPTGGHDPDASNRPRAMFPPRHRSPEDERPKAVGACPQRLSRLDRIEPRALRELPDERVLCNATVPSPSQLRGGSNLTGAGPSM
jgi:hypothetical protein